MEKKKSAGPQLQKELLTSFIHTVRNCGNFVVAS
jgi:hypothetical protein